MDQGEEDEDLQLGAADTRSLAPNSQTVARMLQSRTWSLKGSHFEGFSILVQSDGHSSMFRTCNVCHETFSRNSKISIRKHAQMHKDDANAEQNQLEETVLSAMTEFVVCDNRPFLLVDSPHFRKLINQIIVSSRIFDSNGMNLMDHLPTSYDISNEIKLKYDSYKEQFLNIYKPIAAKSGFAFTVDFSQAGPDYAVITFHYIDSEWQLQSQILAFIPYPFDQRKTEENIVEFVEFQLQEIGFSKAELRKAAFVTDEASNMKGFDIHVTCACHVLNTVAFRLTSLYVDSKLNETMQKDCKHVHSALKDLQTFVGKLRGITAIRQNLGTALHVSVKTRWMSGLKTCECFALSSEEIERVIKEYRPELLPAFKSIYERNIEIFDAYRKILKHFEIRINNLEGDKYVTISQYVPAILSLHYILTNMSTDINSDKYTKSMASAGVEALDRKIKKWDKKLMFSASYLDPKMRSQLYSLLDAHNYISKETIVRYIHEFASEENNAADSVLETEGFEYFPTKRYRSNIEKEISLYDSMYLGEKSKNPLDFWKRNEDVLPVLTKIAKRILCIPASSAPSERAFSQFKLNTPPARNRLSDERIQQLLVVKSMLKSTTDVE